MEEELTPEPATDKYFTVEVEENGECKRTLTLTATDEALQQEKKRIIEKLRKDINVPGFRRGKVPLSYISKNYDGAVYGDAVQNLLSRAYEQAVVSKGLRPLADPQFEELKAEDGEGISVKAHIEVKPNVTITGYTGVKLQVEKRVIGDEQVDGTLDQIREGMAQYQTVDRAVAGEDYVIIDFFPLTDSGELDEAAGQKDYGVTLGSEGLLGEFKEGLQGLKAGEEKEIQVRYPEDFTDKNLAGDSKTFRVSVKEVKEKLMPDIDDAFAQNVTADVKSLEELKDRIREDLQREEDAKHKQDVQEKIIDKIIEANTFEVPEAMVNNYLTSIVEEDRRRRPDVPSEEAREREVRELFREPALRMVKRYLIMEAVVRQEEMTVTPEEFDKKIETLAEGAGRPLEELMGIFREGKHRRNLENELLDQKVLIFLREKSDIKVA